MSTWGRLMVITHQYLSFSAPVCGVLQTWKPSKMFDFDHKCPPRPADCWPAICPTIKLRLISPSGAQWKLLHWLHCTVLWMGRMYVQCVAITLMRALKLLWMAALGSGHFLTHSQWWMQGVGGWWCCVAVCVTILMYNMLVCHCTAYQYYQWHSF